MACMGQARSAPFPNVASPIAAMKGDRMKQLTASDFLTNEDIAQLVRVPVSTVRYWKHMGEGPRSMKVGRRVLHRREDVEVWLASKYEGTSA